MKKLGVLLAAGALIYFYQARQAAKSLKVAFLSAKFRNGESAATYYKYLFFTLRLKIRNPTEFKGKINEIRANVIIGKTKVAFLDSSQTVELKPRGEVIVEIPVRVTTASIFPTITDAWQQIKTNGKLSARIVGSITAPIGTYSFDTKGTLNIL